MNHKTTDLPCTNHFFRLGMLLAVLFSLAGQAVYGQDDPLKIESDSVVHNLDSSLVTFKGNVTMSRSFIRVEADSVEYENPQDGTEVARAFGSPVRIFGNFVEGNPEFKGAANQMLIYEGGDTVHLIGDVLLEQQNVTVTAPAAYYYGKTKTFETRGDTEQAGSGRTTATLFGN